MTDANMLSADYLLMDCSPWLIETHTTLPFVPACVLSVDQALLLGFVDVVSNGTPVALASTALLGALVQGVTCACGSREQRGSTQRQASWLRGATD